MEFDDDELLSIRYALIQIASNYEHDPYNKLKIKIDKLIMKD